jgi:hypothetical protein
MTRLLSRPALASVALRVGAFATLVTGADHLEEYTANHFSTVPTIGTLFLLNFASATVIGICLLLPLNRISARSAAPVQMLLALAGLGLSAASLVSLWISEHSSLFGFTDHGYRTAIVVAITAESIAVLSFAAYLLLLDRHPAQLVPKAH